MLLRFDAYLNGVSFAQLDPAIILCDIVEKPPKEDRDEAKRALHPGTRISSRTRRSLPVELIFWPAKSVSPEKRYLPPSSSSTR